MLPFSGDGLQLEHQAYPLARVVSDRYDGYSFYRLMQGLRRGVVRFDDLIRHPFEPEGPVEVDCVATKEIGVAYALFGPKPPDRRRARRVGATQAMAHFIWEHDTHDFSGSEFDHRERLILWRKQDFRVYYEKLKLRGDNKENGVYTLTASIDGTPMFRSQFRLTGCEDYRTWLEKWRELQQRKKQESVEQADPDDLPFY